MKSNNYSINRLLGNYKQISLLSKINAILGWDLNVNLPPKAVTERADQSAAITEYVISLWKKKEFISLLQSVNQDDPKLREEERAIILNLNHGAKYFLKVPQKLIIEKEKLTTKAFIV